MLVPFRNQRPVRPFRHPQEPAGNSQTLQARPAASELIEVLRGSADPGSGVAAVGVRANALLAEPPRILWATATGATPGGAAAAAFVALPANRTNCLYLSNSCRYFFRSGSATDIPPDFARRA